MSIRTAVSFEDAARECACTYVAGATDLMPLFKNGVRDDAHLVLLRDVPELGGIAEEDGCIVIDAGQGGADLPRHEAQPVPPRPLPAAPAARRGGLTPRPVNKKAPARSKGRGQAFYYAILMIAIS